MTSEGSVRKLTRSQLRETKPVYRKQVKIDWCSSLLQYIDTVTSSCESVVSLSVSHVLCMTERSAASFIDPDVRYVDPEASLLSRTLPHARLHHQTAKRTYCTNWDPRGAVSERTRDKLVSEPSDGPEEVSLRRRAADDRRRRTTGGQA